MKAGRKKQLLTDKEAEIMNMLWERGPLFIREMVEMYPDPKPPFNTVATNVRTLEGKGYVSHECFGPTHRFYAVVKKEYFRDRSFADLIKNYFSNSYKNAVSALAEENKITLEELKEIVKLLESTSAKKGLK